MFNCPLNKWPPRHRCPGVHCCRDRGDCIRQACSAFFAPLRRRIEIPALNRWLSVYPVVCIVLFLNCIHGIFGYAQSVMLGSNPLDGHVDGCTPDDVSDAERQNVGAPRQTGFERKLRKRRQRKMTTWLNSRDCKTAIPICRCGFVSLHRLFTCIVICSAQDLCMVAIETATVRFSDVVSWNVASRWWRWSPWGCACWTAVLTF